MWAILRFELMYYIKNKSELIENIGIFISVCLLVPFGIHHADIEYQYVASIILWLALIVMWPLGSVGMFKRDQQSGRLEGYQLVGLPLEQVVISKWAAFYLQAILPILIVLPGVLLLFGTPLEDWGHIALGLASGGLALSLLSTLMAVLLTGMDRAGALLSLMLLPLTIPVMIFGTEYVRLTEEILQASLFFLLGFSAILAPILAVVGASCIRTAH